MIGSSRARSPCRGDIARRAAPVGVRARARDLRDDPRAGRSTAFCSLDSPDTRCLCITITQWIVIVDIIVIFMHGINTNYSRICSTQPHTLVSRTSIVHSIAGVPVRTLELVRPTHGGARVAASRERPRRRP